jgi:hypothetical protein
MSVIDDPISLFRRQLAVSTLLQNGLLALAGGCVLLTLLGLGPDNLGFYLLMCVMGLWVYLGYRSMRVTESTGEVPSLIAAGEFAQAEDAIVRGLTGFSLFRASRLMGLHHLVVLRHAQRRWAETVALGSVLLQQKLGSLRGVSGSTQILLAESLLELGDLRGAHGEIAGLYSRRLSLGEALGVMRLQLDYSARVGAWGQMLQNVGDKIRLCELMTATNAARSQALLAVAARRGGKMELSAWLRDRAELLEDRTTLVGARRVLGELWGSGCGGAGGTSYRTRFLPAKC